jgi:ribosomal protein S14
MSETCDRCGPAVRAVYRVDRTGELYLCRHCASRLWRELTAQGWTIWPLGGHALAPQASPPLQTAR